MLQFHCDPRLEALLEKFDAAGGVLDYVPLKTREVPSDQAHRRAAVMAMTLIDRNLEKWAVANCSDDIPVDRFFRVTIDEDRLHGEQIPFADFWGNDNVTPEQLSPRAWSIPNVDGYKTAFFHPPYGVRLSQADTQELFESINAGILGSSPESCTVYSWSTDWSNYFDAGHEWWGTFFWTVYSPELKLVTAIGASSTD